MRASLVAYKVAAIPAALAAIVWTVTLSLLGNSALASDWAVLTAATLLCLSTACATACILARTIARLRRDSSWWAIVRRRGAATFLVLLALTAIGGTMSLAVPYYIAWFLCAFFFMYALPIVVGGNANWFGSLCESARLAIRHPGATFVSVSTTATIGIAGFVAAYFASSVPYAGVFLQSLVLQFALGFLAVLTFQQLPPAIETQAPAYLTRGPAKLRRPPVRESA